MKWSGFRKVRRQVCKRVERRLTELRLPDHQTYRSYLEAHAEEWEVLDSFCRITISRFYRDRDVFAFLDESVLPTLARLASDRAENEFRCWSAGCASGEEPYTIAIVWRLHHEERFRTLPIRVVATDVDQNLLSRAQRAVYPQSSLRDLPRELTTKAFQRREDDFVLRPAYRGAVEFVRQDIRRERPEESFHLILCRNLIFTYFEAAVQRDLLQNLVAHLVAGGALAIGRKEALPEQNRSPRSVERQSRCLPASDHVAVKDDAE
jgi:chemotaxis protein methyltransferase CheR